MMRCNLTRSFSGTLRPITAMAHRFISSGHTIASSSGGNPGDSAVAG